MTLSCIYVKRALSKFNMLLVLNLFERLFKLICVKCTWYAFFYIYFMFILKRFILPHIISWGSFYSLFWCFFYLHYLMIGFRAEIKAKISNYDFQGRQADQLKDFNKIISATIFLHLIFYHTKLKFVNMNTRPA